MSMQRQLREREKELNCIYSAYIVTQQLDKDYDNKMNEILDILVQSWQYPEITAAKIKIHDDEWKTPRYKKTDWFQRVPLYWEERYIGYIEAVYLVEKPPLDEGPFLKEERALINQIAEFISLFYARERERQTLIMLKEKAEKAEERLKEHTKLLELKNKELDMIANGAEDELRQQNGLLTSLLDSIPDLVFYKDLNGVYLGGNAAYAEYIGISLQEIAGKTDYDLHSKEEADSNRYRDMKLLQSLQTFQHEEWVTYPDGRKILLDTLKTPYMDHEGNLIGILGIGRDITERKQAEEALKLAKQQAEAANEAKSRYLTHMNHEMRTPLNGLLGFVGLMEETRLDEEQQAFMCYIKQSANHMLSIVNNVLDHAQIEAGEIMLDHKPFLLEKEIQTSLAPLYSLARQQNLSLQLTLAEDLPQKVVGDPQRLRQILLNLAGNAVRFTEEGQVHITVTCPESPRDHHILHLVVEDTGTGMTEKILEKLFQPFYQADDGSVRQSKGTGLGLVITRELVKLMGGRIQVESTLGKGTRVEATLQLMKG